MNGPTIAVCIGTFGSVEWALRAERRAAPSAERQTVRPQQVIHYHGADLRAARNGAAGRAKTEWLCFLDADDELDPGYIEAMSMAAMDAGDALLQPATLGVYPDGREDAHPVVIPGKPLLDGNFMVIGTLIRREQFDRLGGFGDWPIYEDWDLWIRAWRDGARLVAVPDAIYRVYVNSGGRNAGERSEQIRVYNQIRTLHANGRASQ